MRHALEHKGGDPQNSPLILKSWQLTQIPILEALKQDIKQLDDGMRASCLQIGDAFNLNANNIEAVKQDVASIKTTMATKEDLSKLEVRFDKLDATQAEYLHC